MKKDQEKLINEIADILYDMQDCTNPFTIAQAIFKCTYGVDVSFVEKCASPDLRSYLKASEMTIKELRTKLLKAEHDRDRYKKYIAFLRSKEKV